MIDRLLAAGKPGQALQAWGMTLGGGLLSGLLLAWIMLPARGSLATPVVPLSAVLPAQPLTPLAQPATPATHAAAPASGARPAPRQPAAVAPPLMLPPLLQEVQQADATRRARLLARLSDDIYLGRYDPFQRLIISPRKAPVVLPPLPEDAPAPPRPAPATRVGLVLVLTGRAPAGLVRVREPGRRPYQAVVRVGQPLPGGFTVRELAPRAMRIENARGPLTLAVGQEKAIEAAPALSRS